MEIIMGFALMAGLFFLMALMFQRGDAITGPIAFLIFAGFGVFTMNLMSSAIYTEWNNTDIYNSSMGVPNTLMNISFWSVWVWLTLVILGVLFSIMKWWTRQDGVKERR